MKLREKVFYHLVRPRLRTGLGTAETTSLAFAKSMRIELESSDVAHQVILWTGFYELEVSRRIARLARCGGLLVDVGANYGYYTAIWAGAKNGNTVVAFEANQENVAALKRNIAANSLGKSVRAVGKAVGQKSGVAAFLDGYRGQTGQGRLVNSADPDAYQVDVITLDEEFRSLSSPIDVLKIDVEGADTLVLEGAVELLRQKRITHIFYEQFPERIEELGISASRAHDLLSGAGYVIEQLAADQFYACAPEVVQ
jgi:FkbM family methyltransferase